MLLLALYSRFTHGSTWGTIENTGHQTWLGHVPYQDIITLAQVKYILIRKIV